MKLRLLFITLIPLFTLSACSDKKNAEAFTASLAAGISNPSSPDTQIDQPAVGKINSKEFKPVAATLFTDPFEPQNAEIILSEEPVVGCWRYFDRYITVPLLSKADIYGDYSSSSGEWMMVLFYANEDGIDYNGNVSNANISWSVKNEDGQDVAYFNISDSSKKNQLIGSLPLQSCL